MAPVEDEQARSGANGRQSVVQGELADLVFQFALGMCGCH